MTAATRRGIVAIVIAAALLALGTIAGFMVAGLLGVRVGDGPIPTGSTERDQLMAWYARILLVLAIAWVVIGMLAARTRLVRRPGAAAARASWIASTRPWRARESTLGMLPLDRWLLLLVPAALLVATRAVEASFAAWGHLAVVLGAWAVFAIVVRLCIGGRSPWPAIGTVGGIVVLRCILTLVPLSFGGPGAYWRAFWTDPALRVVYIAFAFALFAWMLIALGWTFATQIGPRRATGFVLAGAGAAVAVPAFVVAALGLSHPLTAGDQLGALPWAVERMLGFAPLAQIPDAAAWSATAFGVVVTVVGVAMAQPRRVAAASVDR